MNASQLDLVERPDAVFLRVAIQNGVFLHLAAVAGPNEAARSAARRRSDVVSPELRCATWQRRTLCGLPWKEMATAELAAALAARRSDVTVADDPATCPVCATRATAISRQRTRELHSTQ